MTCNLHHRGIERIDSLSHLRNLRALDLSFNRIRRIENLSALGQLRELKLYGNRLTAVEGLEALGQLQVLSLEGNALERLENLGALRNLRELRVGHNRLESLRGLGRLPALEVVSAPQNAIASLEGLEGLAALRRLDLEGNRLASLAGLGRLAPRIEELALSGNPLGTGGLRGLERLAKSLDVLHIARCGLEGALASALPATLPEVTELFAGANRLTGPGAALGARLPALEILDVSANLIADPGALGSLAAVPMLVDLRFEGNPACAVLGERYSEVAAEVLPGLEALDDSPVEEAGFGAAEETGMAEFLAAKGITSLGVHEALAVGAGAGGSRPPSARPGSERPGSARPGSARPGSARPGTPLGGRPGSSSRAGAGIGAAPLMQLRGWSERTGLGGKLLSACEYEATSEAFADEVAEYRSAMRRVVADLRSGYLEPSAGEALAALRAAGGDPGVAATASLPRPPVAPVLQGSIGDIVGRGSRDGEQTVTSPPSPPGSGGVAEGKGPSGRGREKHAPLAGPGSVDEAGLGERGVSGRGAGSPPRVLVVDGYDGHEAVTIRRLEDTELSSRADAAPAPCDDAGVATGGLPAATGPAGGEARGGRRRAGAGNAAGVGYRHFKLPPRTPATVPAGGAGLKAKQRPAPTPGSGPARSRKSSPHPAPTPPRGPSGNSKQQPRAPLQPRLPGSGEARGRGPLGGRGPRSQIENV